MMRQLCLWVSLMVLGWSSGASALPINNPITAGLVAAYEFSGNADDVTGNGNDGVVYGATSTADRFGNAGSAYSFDGVDDFIISSGTFPQQVSGTIAFWFRDTSPNGTGGTFLSSRSTSGYETGDLIVGNEESGDLFRAIYWGSGSWEGFGSLNLPTNSWEHFSLSWDTDDGARIYVDGVEAPSGYPPYASTAPAYPIFAGLPLVLGRDQVFHWGSWVTDFGEGDIDDVYIYDRALSASEVQTLYSAVPEPSTALLLGLGLAGIAIRKRR